METDVRSLRKQLSEAVGDEKYRIYKRCLSRWLSGRKINKEDFDAEVRDRILPPETIHLHNQLMVSILNICFKPSDSQPQQKRFKAENSSGTQALDFVSRNHVINSHNSKLYPSGGVRMEFASDTGSVVDYSMIRGRILVCNWEHDLDSFEETVISIFEAAIENFIKNILTCIIKLRRSYTLRDGRFPHKFGHAPALGDGMTAALTNCRGKIAGNSLELDPSTVTYTALAYPSSCIELYDLLHAIQLDKRLLPPNLMRLTLERIFARL